MIWVLVTQGQGLGFRGLGFRGLGFRGLGFRVSISLTSLRTKSLSRTVMIWVLVTLRV